MDSKVNEYQTATVAGAGIMGLLTAWKLSNAGLEVRVSDWDMSGGTQSTSYYAGGMLSPVSELEKADRHIYDLGIRSLDLWQDILSELGAPHLLKRNGSLCVAHERDMPLLKSFAEKIRAAGFEDHIKPVDGSAIEELEPALAGRFSAGYFIEGEGHLFPRDVMVVLREKLLARGVKFDEGIEAKWGATKLHAGQESDLTIDCRGIGAQDRFEDLRGVKGEMAIVQTPELSLNRPVRMMHPRYPLYIVPRPDHQFMIGATELESENMKHVSVRSALELLSALYALHPSFSEADIIELGIHLRPAFEDNAPRIVMERDQVAINGLYRHGYLISPALAELAYNRIMDISAKTEDQVA